jgi:hypothetical protein
MRESYEGHPAFRFEGGSWSLKKETLSNFNTTYAAVQSIGNTLSQGGWLAACMDCRDALRRVKEEIEVQCADELEAKFFQELWQELDRLMGEELDWYRRPQQRACADLENSVAREKAIAMQVDRYFFDRLPTDVVNEIRELAADDIERFRVNAAAGRLTRDDLSINTGKTVHAIVRLLNEAYSKQGVLDAVSAYVGRKTQVGGLALELSVAQATWWKNAIPGIERPANTLYAHIDESIAYPKSIVYLSNVTESNGPTGCYPGAYEALNLNPLQEMIGRVVGIVGNAPNSPLKTYYQKQYHQSASSERFRQHFMRLPASLRFNSHMGWDVNPGSDLETQLAEGECKMIGPAGSFIVFDGGRLVHRGGLIQQGERVALQVIFVGKKTLFRRVLDKVRKEIL